MRIRLGAFAGVAVALGALSVPAVWSPAHADRFAASYACSVPLFGVRPVMVSGTLDSSPVPPTAGVPTRFLLRIASLRLRSAIPINAWSATAEVLAEGAQSASFRLHGSGGWVPARRPITGRLTGAWTPTAAGVTRLRPGAITIKANVSLLGDVTVPCTPRGDHPLLATLTITPTDHPPTDLTTSRSPWATPTGH